MSIKARLQRLERQARDSAGPWAHLSDAELTAIATGGRCENPTDEELTSITMGRDPFATTPGEA